ncbi:receptor-like protein EIX2 [Abrus precatorius]|uniref:Receptor-like protein EIX2 n=1 Tax=Abrus precatorius TaxID=3816 RepID=A0A8B8M9L7_ABRPR|nr:receptor-like protein EIX2 [Abrus precatorius]
MERSELVDKSHCLPDSIHLSFVDFEFLNYLDLSNNDFLAIQFDYVNSQNGHNLSLATPPRQCLNSSVLCYLDLSLNENLAIDNLQWLSHFSSLEYLDLGGVDLHNETNWLQLVTMLPSLSQLHLSNCQLEDLSPSLQYANFTSLQVLHLSKNKFHSELPKWLFNLTCGISNIYLHDNILKGQLPKALLNLRHLESLNLVHNNFNGPIPDWLGQLEHQQHLLLSRNMFSGSIPENLGNLSSLIVLTVDENELRGVVSERNFAKLSKLKVLDIHLSPPLIFDFNPHWVPPFQLKEISLGFAAPKLPAWLDTQRSLVSLGYIPNWIAKSAKALQLRSNQFNGNIPPQICQMSSLIILDIGDNRISGHIPNCLNNIKSFVINSASSSKLTFYFNFGDAYYSFVEILELRGRIPEEIGNMKNMESLDFSTKRLMGDIPQGKIPSSTQLQGFGELSYAGNCDLCGPPLPKICLQDAKSKDTKPLDEEVDESELLSWPFLRDMTSLRTLTYEVEPPIQFSLKRLQIDFGCILNPN